MMVNHDKQEREAVSMNNIDQKYTAAPRGIPKLVGIGICMGAANIIPGVSGGTIAFIFGIYADLIRAIKLFDFEVLKMACRRQWKKLLDYFPWRFLAAILSGVVLAIFSFAKLMSWLLQYQPVPTFAFFFGLILATAPVIGRTIKQWNPSVVALGIISTIGMYFFVGMVPVNTPDSLWFLFLCGAIAVSTMILPGISGSFVLVILGKYQYIIDCISHRDIVPLGVVALGCAVGILIFIRILNWLLNRYHDQTLVVLAGMVLGSLRKVWPWKETLKVTVSSKGKIIPIEQINQLPAEFSPEVVLAVILFVLGLLLAWNLGGRSESQNLQTEE